MTDLQTATLGRTGLDVTKLAYGAMELRGEAWGFGRPIEPETADRVLNSVLDAGINFIDTSPDYGMSEELIGRFISRRRDEYFLASKCGCIVGDAPRGSGPPFEHVFTRENIRAAVEQSLERMQTDHLDLVQVHMSPPRQVLEENGAVDELEALRDAGKVRFIGMSGVLPDLADHISMGVFDAFQIPYSALERDHEEAISSAAQAGGGTIIRGGVARGIPDPSDPKYAELPERFVVMLGQRKDRWASVELDDLLDGMSTMEFMLRFTLSHPDMTTTIVGTANPDHLADNVAAARKGPLDPDVYDTAMARLAAVSESR
jgi:aryl-alcohol dehydrogenase-like predicted oxidoreductase